ncbi:glycosyltransferase [Desulfonatronospira sp.]|uniref:glycosyltransferase n=1 Tax=Desulfonatronospira sp. TaxID=1962951 RepID=UPI0025C4115C|nr:glycosyltransferase [Desulfonatronospira sp.]
MEKFTSVDMHVHSRHSTRPSQWGLQKLGCSESYTGPEFIYKRLRDKGMDLVTITDHNCIDGCLEIAHKDGVFVSEEITAHFPDDGCKVHVLAYDISEEQHSRIQEIRFNIFELVSYLQTEDILHAAAHPLFSVNGKMSYENFERLLLLFKIMECNGARDKTQNEALEFILDNLCPLDFEYLQNKYDLKAAGNKPWEKSIIGGSDDHSSLNIGRMFTRVPGIHNLKKFLEQVNKGCSNAWGTPSTPKTMAHNLYSIGYQFCKHKFNLHRYTGQDSLLQFLDQTLHPGQKIPKNIKDSILGFIYKKTGSKGKTPAREFHRLLSRETELMLRTDPEITRMVQSSVNPHEYMGSRWFRFANKAGNRLLSHEAGRLVEQAASAGFLDMFQTLGSAGSLYTMLSPYFVSYGIFNQDRRTSKEFISSFKKRKGIRKSAYQMRVAHFTDTFYEINGVARTMQQLATTAAVTSKDLTIITCRPDSSKSLEMDGVQNFEPMGMLDLPEYPEIKLYYPPVLEMIDYCFERDTTHLHTATPGPMGLAALATATILGLPIFGTYHTSLPQYTGHLTGDHALEALMWKYIIWYYNQLDKVFAPSKSTADELRLKGVRSEKIKVYPRGVDTDKFNPAKRNGFFARHYKIQNKTKLLYVGRISKEKNLQILEKAFQKICEHTSKVHLVIVGDGPYRYEMEYRLKDYPATFTGYLQGEELSQAYASSDLFVFPSSTDTFGNVVLEAQASGVPAIVVDQGGPGENIIQGDTGLVVPAEDSHALKRAILSLLAHPEDLREMGQKARKYMESRSFKKAFEQTWEMYRECA